MENKDPIFVYDSRTQFTKPMFIVYEYELIDPFLKNMGIDDVDGRPDWVIVTKQRMHPYEPNPYKVPGLSTKNGGSTVRSAHARNDSALISLLTKKVTELEKKNSELSTRALKAEADIASWKDSNMNALRDLAIEILTKKS